MDFYMAEASRILSERDAGKPLFLYFAHQEVHIPLEAPPGKKYEEACALVTATDNRNTLCKMTNILDESIGDFVAMLKDHGMWENTLMWVTTDNGGMTQFQADFPASASSNYPLRAGKVTLFEGGVRGISFVTGGFLPSSASGRQVDGLLQHVDITTTLAALGGGSLPQADGHNVWNVIADGAASPRSEVPINVDPGFCNLNNTAGTGFSALISKQWKLINGTAGVYDSWWSNGDYTEEKSTATSSDEFVNGRSVWLFNLDEDPTERINVAKANPDIVAAMQTRLAELVDPSNGYVAVQDNSPDPKAFPVFHHGSWAPWKNGVVLI